MLAVGATGVSVVAAWASVTCGMAQCRRSVTAYRWWYRLMALDGLPRVR